MIVARADVDHVLRLDPDDTNRAWRIGIFRAGGERDVVGVHVAINPSQIIVYQLLTYPTQSYVPLNTWRSRPALASRLGYMLI